LKISTLIFSLSSSITSSLYLVAFLFPPIIIGFPLANKAAKEFLNMSTPYDWTGRDVVYFKPRGFNSLSESTPSSFYSGLAISFTTYYFAILKGLGYTICLGGGTSFLNKSAVFNLPGIFLSSLITIGSCLISSLAISLLVFD
jgi:hypothetical protein